VSWFCAYSSIYTCSPSTNIAAILGAKLITPFGFMGQFATRDFRQRLKDHYHAQSTQSDAAAQPGNDPSSRVDTNRFLLDYVLDMGPASLIPRAPDEDSDPSYPVVEPSDVQQSDHFRPANDVFS
jgi:hypothetical protein